MIKSSVTGQALGFRKFVRLAEALISRRSATERSRRPARRGWLLAEESLESRVLLAASFGFDYTTVASNLHPTERFFGSTDPDNAPFTILRYGFGQVTSLVGLPTTSAGINAPGDLTFVFGSDDVNNPVEALSLSAFDNGLSDGTANETYTPDGVNDVPTLTVFNMGTAVATGSILKIALDIDTSGIATSPASNPSSFQLTSAVGPDTRIFDELMAATNNTGIVEFTLSAFNYTGPWVGVGDAEYFSSTGQTINLVDPPAPTDDHGNDIGTATAWDRAAPIAGVFEAAISDQEDFFAVQLQAGRQYTFQAEDLDGVADESTWLVVRDGTGDLISEGDQRSGSSGWQVWSTVSPTTTGTYYLQVFNSGAVGAGNYSVSQVSDVAIPGDDHPDEGETAWDRSAPIAGNIEIPNDTDWFSVTLTQDVEYVFRTNAGTLLDSVLGIYDSDFNLLDENDDDGDALQYEYHSKLTFAPPSTGTYYLAVNGYGDSNPGFEEAFRVGSYTLEQVSQTAPVPERPVIDAASNPVTTDQQRPTFTWAAAANAVEYDVFIATVTDPGTPIVRARVASTSFTPDVDLGIGRLKVWVQGISAANVRGPWSLPLGVRINTAASIDLTPDQFYATTTQPEFTWNSLAGAVSYEVWANNVLTGASKVIDTTVSEPSYTPASPLTAGIYRYWVRGVSADGLIGQWSAFSQIYVGPVAVSPVQPTFEVLPTFEWTDPGDVASYDVWLQRGGTVVATPTGIIGTTWTPAANLTAGDYRWWVRPNLNNSVKGPWSLMRQFNVSGIPVVETPGAITSTTTISWSAVTDAVSYDIYIRRDSGGQAFVQQVNRSATSLDVDTSLPGTYRIWVRAISSTAVTSNWSRPLTFTVSDASDTGELLSNPANGMQTLATAQLRLLPGDAVDQHSTPADPVSGVWKVSQGVVYEPDAANPPVAGQAGQQLNQPSSAELPSTAFDLEDQVMAGMHELLQMLDA